MDFDYSKWVGTLTEADHEPDPVARRNNHLRRCRVYACQGMDLEGYATVYRGQQEMFPALGVFGPQRIEPSSAEALH